MQVERVVRHQRMKPNRLVLFDIDGTLLHGGGLWAGSFVHSLNTFFPGSEMPLVKFGGRTDYHIVQECLSHWGCSDEEIEAKGAQILDFYLNTVEKSVRSGTHHEIEVLEGAMGLLNRLNGDPRVRLAVLTGNIQRGADLKLKYAEMDSYFEMKVTGDDHWDRYELPAIAQKRAKELGLGEFQGKEIVIIGDTIHDVNCGKKLGVRTIAVGTGRGVDRDELLAQNPDFFFHTLADIQPVLKAIIEDLA